MAKIIFTNKEFAGKEVELKREITTVGRAPDNLLEIHDSSVSAHHCEIHANNDEIIIRELEAKNGIFVDDVKVNGQLPVRNSQTIRLGEVELRLEIPFRVEEDTEITTMLTLEHVERERREREAREAGGTSHIKATLGEEKNTDEDTIIFTKSKPEAKPGDSPEANYKEHEPQFILPEPKSKAGLWIKVALGVVVLAAVAVFIMTQIGK